MKKTLFLYISLFLLLVLLGIGVYFYILPQFQKSQESLYSLDPHIQEIKSRGKVIIGTEATYPPMEFIDENGNFAGIDIEIAKEIAKNLGVEPEFRNIAWDNLFGSLINGEVDFIISSITILPERAEIMNFSNPYFNAGQTIVVKKSRALEIKKVEDLYNKKVGVQENTTSEFESKKYTNKIVGYETYDTAVEDLLAEKIDAIVIDYPAAIGLTKNNPQLTIIGEPFTQEFYGVATRKKDQALLDIINQTIADLKRSGKLDQIINSWMQ